MTDQEWLACTAPTPMLEFLRDRASDRTLHTWWGNNQRPLPKRLDPLTRRVEHCDP